MDSTKNKSEYWRQIISEWRSSGQTKKQFAASRDISADAMGYWITKLKKTKTHKAVRSDFVPVSVVDSTDQNLTLHLSNGISLSFAPGISVQFVVQVAMELSKTIA